MIPFEAAGKRSERASLQRITIAAVIKGLGRKLVETRSSIYMLFFTRSGTGTK